MLARKVPVIIVTLCCLVLSVAPSVTANHRAASSIHHHVAGHHHHHHRHHQGSARKIVSVAAPIGAGVAFGPAGSIGYQGFKYRRAIKHHLARHSRS
jgi:hypothetical protein